MNKQKLLKRTDLNPYQKLIEAISQGWYKEETIKEIQANPDLKVRVEEVFLEELTSREIRVLTLRYGLEDGEPKTLKEIGQRFGVTSQVIRAIEAKALRRLRHPSRFRRLKIKGVRIKEEDKRAKLERRRKIEEEDQALMEIFKNSSFSYSPNIFYTIRAAGITYSDLETLSLEEVVEKLGMTTPSERCLREMWKKVHSSK